MNPRSLPLLAALLTALFLLGAAVWSQSAAPVPLTLIAKDGRRSIPVVLVNEQEFVALDELAATFQLAVRDEGLGALTVTYKAKTIVLTPDQAIASVAGRLVSLPAAPSRAGRQWLVPVEFIARAVAPIYDQRLDLRKAAHLLIVGDIRVPRVTARYDVFGAGGRLTVDATPRASALITQDNDKLLLKFDADALDLAPMPQLAQGPQSLLQAIRFAEPTTLIVELGPRFGGFKASEEPVDTTTRLVIDFLTVQTDTRAAPPPPPPMPAPTPPALPVSGVRTIGIDPGHGGDDDGVHGAEGVKEKDVTLAVARRIKALVEGRLGIRVLVTREEDRTVPIDERTAVANNNKVDLFISLHANASLRKSASGASIFCAAFDEGAVKAAASSRAERLPVFGGGTRDIDLVAWDRAQMRYLDRSMAFATMLEEQLRDRVPLTPQPISRAPLGVLQSANMPAVLVEMGFLSNAEQEKQLTGAEFQTAFVQGVFDAVVKFRDAMSPGDAR